MFPYGGGYRRISFNTITNKSNSMAVYEFDSDKKVQIMKVDIINNNNESTTYLDRMNPFSINVHYDVRVWD